MREGASEARISIRLRNGGADAYRRDDYGESITIVRTIKREGQSSYKIKAHNGRVVEQKADEVKQICDAFNIQVRWRAAADCPIVRRGRGAHRGRRRSTIRAPS